MAGSKSIRVPGVTNYGSVLEQNFQLITPVFVCDFLPKWLLCKRSTEMDASAVVVPGTGDAVGPPLEEHSPVFATYSQDSQLH